MLVSLSFLCVSSTILCDAKCTNVTGSVFIFGIFQMVLMTSLTNHVLPKPVLTILYQLLVTSIVECTFDG